MDRSTSLVIEYSAAVERIYKTAEDTREFKRVARNSAEALLQELAPKMRLPYPLPACTLDQWNAGDGNRPEGHVLTAWWAFVAALLVGTKIIMPNRLRATWDPNTRQRNRAEGHLVFKLEFGDLSFSAARALQAGLGQRLNQTSRAGRDAGEVNPTTMYIHKTPEEQPRGSRTAGQEQPKGKGRGGPGGERPRPRPRQGPPVRKELGFHPLPV